VSKIAKVFGSTVFRLNYRSPGPPAINLDRTHTHLILEWIDVFVPSDVSWCMTPTAHTYHCRKSILTLLIFCARSWVTTVVSFPESCSAPHTWRCGNIFVQVCNTNSHTTEGQFKQGPTHVSKSQHGGKGPTCESQVITRIWLIIIKVGSWLFNVKIFVGLGLRVGSNF
jgi:hypothetical protein